MLVVLLFVGCCVFSFVLVVCFNMCNDCVSDRVYYLSCHMRYVCCVLVCLVLCVFVCIFVCCVLFVFWGVIVLVCLFCECLCVSMFCLCSCALLVRVV